jgi:putative PIN family toxin of toxin-antitoxin system
VSEEGVRQPRPRAAFDCAIYLQAVLRRGAPAGACLDLVEEGTVELIISEPVFAEVEEVLNRPELKPRRQGRLTSSMVAEILDWIRAHATLVADVPEVFHYPRDPNDEPYLNLAIAGGAHYLVSRDNDLLDLQDPQSEPGRELRRLAPQLTILDPVAFLALFPVLSGEAPSEDSRGSP